MTSLSSAPTIQLIVGLGNPGDNYTKTRHNAGFWFIDKLCTEFTLREKPQLVTKFKSLLGVCEIAGHTCRLLQPMTYMNRSGEVTQAVADFYKILPQQILVIHDELDLPCGSVRLKFDGGHGGHNGLRDLIARLGTRQFYRLRLGIGHPGHKDDVTNYVLNRPSKDEEKHIFSAIEQSLTILPELIGGSAEKAMQTLHTSAK